MSKSNTSYRILNEDGSYGYISRKRAEACLRNNRANLVRSGVIRFTPQVAASSERRPVRPAWGAALGTVPWVTQDSDIGQTFLHYPQSRVFA